MEYNISDAAVVALRDFARRASGDETLGFRFEYLDGKVSRYVPEHHRIEVDHTVLLRNPEGVLRIVTPFRLKQEAAITGAILHEVTRLRVSDLEEVTEYKVAVTTHSVAGNPRVLEFARVIEEVRIDNSVENTEGLGWTVRATAAKALGGIDWDSTEIMDVMVRSILTAGRFVFQNDPPEWARHEWTWLWGKVAEHLISTYPGRDVVPMEERIRTQLDAAMTSAGKSAQRVLSAAHTTLSLLFPDNDAPEIPAPGQAGGSTGAEGPDEEYYQDHMETSAGETGSEPSGESDDPGDPKGTLSTAAGLNTEYEKGFTPIGRRGPGPPDRVVQQAASKFLASVIDPSTSTIRSLDDSPSSEVDPEALAVWRSAGADSEPRFFVRTRRETTPSVPAKIALLVDVSGSMDLLQAPSAQMSWALAAAAEDLSNYAGAGVNVEVVQVNWGSTARVVRHPGDPARTIDFYKCRQGTRAMHEAIELADEALGGSLLSTPERPENRLIVHFSDWVVQARSDLAAEFGAANLRALSAGTKILSVEPVPEGQMNNSYMVAADAVDIACEKAGHSGFRRVTYNGSTRRVWDAAIDMMR